MALDNRNKRASVMGLTLVAFVVLPAPDGTITQPDRQQLLACYAGISAQAIVTPTDRIVTVSVESRIVVVDAEDRIITV